MEGEMALPVFAYEKSRTAVPLSIFEPRGSHAQGLVYRSARARNITGSGGVLPFAESFDEIPHDGNICSYEPHLAWSICEEEERLSRDGLVTILCVVWRSLAPHKGRKSNFIQKCNSQTRLHYLTVPAAHRGTEQEVTIDRPVVDERFGYLGIENSPLAPWRRRRRRNMDRRAGNGREGKKSAP